MNSGLLSKVDNAEIPTLNCVFNLQSCKKQFWTKNGSLFLDRHFCYRRRIGIPNAPCHPENSGKQSARYMYGPKTNGNIFFSERETSSRLSDAVNFDYKSILKLFHVFKSPFYYDTRIGNFAYNLKMTSFTQFDAVLTKFCLIWFGRATQPPARRLPARAARIASRAH